MLEDISALENCTVSSVPDGYDAFLLAQLWEKSAHDILYIVSDGVALENTAHILSVISLYNSIALSIASEKVSYSALLEIKAHTILIMSSRLLSFAMRLFLSASILNCVMLGNSPISHLICFAK